MYYATQIILDGPMVSARFSTEEDRDEWCRRNPGCRQHADPPDDLTGYRHALWSNFPQRDLCGERKELSPVSPEATPAEDPENDFPDDPPAKDIYPPMPPPCKTAPLVPVPADPTFRKDMEKHAAQNPGPRFGLVLPAAPSPAETCRCYAETLQPIDGVSLVLSDTTYRLPKEILTLVRLLAFTGCPVEALKHEARATLKKHGLVTPEEAAQVIP